MTFLKRCRARALHGVILLAAQVAATAAESSAESTMPMTTPAALAARLQERYPATRFGSVNSTPWPGVFEVKMGARLAYVDASGEYFLFGHLFDLPAQRDITAEREASLARIDLSTLPLDDALKEVRGNGTRTLVIFSDPDCPYCHRLDAIIGALSDVTIYTFLLPIASLHPEAREHAISVWCAANRLLAWHARMQNEANDTLAMTNASACAHPIDRNVALGERLGINATPTLVAQDGRVLPGLASLARIESWLGNVAAAQDDLASTPRPLP